MAKNQELYSAMAIGERLRITRLALRMTQRAMAQPLDITREAYTMYETGARKPPWDVGCLMCDAWGLSLDWIYRGDVSGLSVGLVDKINKILPKAQTKTRIM